MKIDLNKILDAARGPQRVTLTLDGRDYVLRRPTVAAVAAIQLAGKPLEGEEPVDTAQRVADFLRDQFDGDGPPFIHTNLRSLEGETMLDAIERMTALLGTIGAIFDELNDEGKVQARTRMEAIQQIVTPRTGLTSSTC